MNPFESCKDESWGSKKEYYFVQFDSIDLGVNYAKKIRIKDGDEKQTARMYLNQYKNKTGKVFRTKSVDDDLWVMREL